MRPTPPAPLFPDDEALREHGFVIAARPAGAPPVWKRDGREYRHADAVNKMRADRAFALKSLEEAYSR